MLKYELYILAERSLKTGRKVLSDKNEEKEEYQRTKDEQLRLKEIHSVITLEILKWII